MAHTAKELFESAIRLPMDLQALLAEQLINNIETHIRPDIESLHCAVAKSRRDDVRAGKIETIEGKDGLMRVRNLLT